MATENFKEAGEIFQNAIEIEDPAKRANYLENACKEDPRLRMEVEALLRAHEKAGDYLEAPAVGANATLDGSAQIEGPGTKIGHYELLELIGEGGMGLVYLAEQKEPVKRRVALKIIKPGMDSKEVIARFEAERQALALLDHPNIAHVFDAGTTDKGRPYFVMEYVKGMSITRYCDERRLDIEQRLRLFQEVCEGVHHAHQKGIIHRDIKPSNILISIHGDRAVPKIIDFGIAKAAASTLTERTMFTFQGQLLGTPEYMSPEQVDLATQDIDTRSDIYSLGVVLYELLAGVLPFERESLQKIGFAELQRTLRELEPASPSIRLSNLGEQAKAIADSRMTQVVPLARRLHRELEWIPLKAMRKDRCRRYRSASEMADDIRNYLTGLPLIAGPETAVYRVKKFVHKHAGSVATVALVAVAVVLGLVVSTAMYFRSEKALQREALAHAQTQEAKNKEVVARERAEQAEKATRDKSEELRRTLYVNSIQLADAKHDEGNILRVRKLLDSCPDDLRGWEWYRLNHISNRAKMTLSGHTDEVYGVAFSLDGKHIASGSFDGTVKVWDAETGAELTTLRGHKGKVGPVSFSPDGKRIVSGGDDKTIKVWDAATGSELMTLYGHGLWTNTVAFSPNGKRIISSNEDKTVKIWDAETGEELMTLRGHNNWVCSAAFSPGSRRIVSCSRDNSIRVWDATTGNELMVLRGEEPILSVAFSPDGKYIVSGGDDRTVRLWDAITGEEVITLHGHSKWIESVAFSPDGRQIVSGGGDKEVKIWDVATGVELVTLYGHQAWISSVIFSPDGKQIASGSVDRTIKVWDARVREEVVTLSGYQEQISSIAFSPNGKRLASGGSKDAVIVWNVETGTELMALCGHDNWAVCVSFSPDGKRIVSGSMDKTIRIWDAANGVEQMVFSGHGDWVASVAFSQDGKHIISGSGDNTIKVWDSVTGKEEMTLRGHTDGVIYTAFSPDGKRIISGSQDNTIRIWDSASGAELMSLPVEHRLNITNRVLSGVFSPDNRRIISGNMHDTIEVWDAANGAEIMTLQGHNNWVSSVTFSPDGKRIISGSGDNTIKVWDSASGAELMTLPADDSILCVAFSPDGKTIAAGCSDNSIKLWESAASADGYQARRVGIAAKELVEELHMEHGLYATVIEKLNANGTYGGTIRKVALQIAHARLWEDEGKTKNIDR